MKAVLVAISLAIALPSQAQEVSTKLLVERIDLAAVKDRLGLKDREKFATNVFQYKFDVVDATSRNQGSFEVHGKNQRDADKIIVSCRRFGPDGNGKKQEDPSTSCGKVYESTLSLFVERPRELTAYLMGEAKRMGKEFSMSKMQIQDFVFEYANDGMLRIRRASRTLP